MAEFKKIRGVGCFVSRSLMEKLCTPDPMVAVSLSGDANAQDVALATASDRADAGWTVNGSDVTFAGEPDRVRIQVMVYANGPTNTGAQRVAPSINLLRNGVVVATPSETGYQRHVTNHNGSSNTIAWTDPNPGANPVYSVQTFRGSSQTDVIAVTSGHITAEAVI